MYDGDSESLVEEIKRILRDNPDVNIFDMPALEQEKLSEQEEEENKRAIEKLGKEFTFLHRNVPPACGKLEMPLNDFELGWVSDHVRDYGFGVFDEYFVLDEDIRHDIEVIRAEDPHGAPLYDALEEVNDKVRRRRAGMTEEED